MTQAKIRQRLQRLAVAFRVFALERRQLFRHGSGWFYWRSTPRAPEPRNDKPPLRGGRVIPEDRLSQQHRSSPTASPNASENRSFRATAELCLPPSPNRVLRHAQESYAMTAAATQVLTPSFQAAYPALSLDRLMSWMREVRANDSLPSSRKTVAWALATYHNSRNGWTFPSLRTLARDCRIAPGAVIDAYR